MSSAAVRPTVLFESTSSGLNYTTASSTVDELNDIIALDHSNSDDGEHRCLDDDSPVSVIPNRKEMYATDGCKRSSEPSIPTLQIIRSADSADYSSDASSVSHVSDASDDIAYSENGILSARVQTEKGKTKKKKPVHKLISMRRKIKKTFSDADATPDGELNIDWRKLAASQTTDENNRFKKKRKSRKSAPFNADLQVGGIVFFAHHFDAMLSKLFFKRHFKGLQSISCSSIHFLVYRSIIVFNRCDVAQVFIPALTFFTLIFITGILGK